MLSFQPITTDARDTVGAYTLPSPYRNCDYAFANMCSWQFLYRSEYAVADGFLFVRFVVENIKQRLYMFPAGQGDLHRAIEMLEREADTEGHRLCLSGVVPESRDELERLYPGQFKFHPERDYFDYIYLRDDLQTLRGKKYQAKRNHINRFKNSYSYTYAPLTPDLIPGCLELECKWYGANMTNGDTEALMLESQSMRFALDHFDALGLTGGVVIVDGQVVAFTYGSPINADTFGVHVEKADVDFDGVFPLINQEFVSRLPEQYQYINREEDLGLPGLRQAKLSYQPAILLEKGTALKK